MLANFSMGDQTMALDIDAQRQQLMDVGYVIVRGMILPDELECL